MSHASLHATCIVTQGAGILLMGAPGSGKSSLALAMMDTAGSGCAQEPMRTSLVADDRVIVESRDGRLVARPPRALAGLLEIRGLGPVRVRHAQSAILRLAVRLVPPSEIERLPDEEIFTIAGHDLPMIRLDPFSPFACARLRAAVITLCQGSCA